MRQMEHIKKFWENQGKLHNTSHKASWGDLFAIELEIETIGKFIKEGQSVLDVGCGNGFSTFRQQEKCPTAKFVGVDCAQTLVAAAKKVKAEKRLSDKEIHFSKSSILALPFRSRSFDTVYTTRVLINLPTWEEQIKGIEECIRVANKGGRVIICEGFWEPLCLLNSLRQLVGLPLLLEHDFNRYLKKSRLDDFLRKKKLSYHVEEFSSLYYLGSRFIRELVDQTNGDIGDYSSPVNELFYNIERQYSCGGVGIQQAYIINT